MDTHGKRGEIDYLQSLANYLIIQLALEGKKAILDSDHVFDIDTLIKARDTILNHLNKPIEGDENGPPKKSTD